MLGAGIAGWVHSRTTNSATWSPGKAVEIRVDAEQLRRTREDHAGFLFELARQRLQHRLALLHAATRKMPARPIAVANQQHAVLAVHDDALGTHGQSARRRQ